MIILSNKEYISVVSPVEGRGMITLGKEYLSKFTSLSALHCGLAENTSTILCCTYHNPVLAKVTSRILGFKRNLFPLKYLNSVTAPECNCLDALKKQR